MECRSWTLDEMEGSYKCLLTRFETSFNCRLTKKSKKGFLTILNWHLGGKKNSSVNKLPSLIKGRVRCAAAGGPVIAPLVLRPSHTRARSLKRLW